MTFGVFCLLSAAIILFTGFFSVSLILAVLGLICLFVPGFWGHSGSEIFSKFQILYSDWQARQDAEKLTRQAAEQKNKELFKQGYYIKKGEQKAEAESGRPSQVVIVKEQEKPHYTEPAPGFLIDHFNREHKKWRKKKSALD